MGWLGCLVGLNLQVGCLLIVGSTVGDPGIYRQGEVGVCEVCIV